MVQILTEFNSEAIARALPHAEQVADRWHLMENSSRAFLDAVSKSMRQIRQAVGTNVVDPKLLTYAERPQYEGFVRRQETNEAVHELARKGMSIRQIVRHTGHSRNLVRNILRGQRLDVFRTKPSSLDEWLPWLNERWDEGTRNALALWREMKTRGFAGQSGVVSQWAQRRRLAERANQSGLARTPSARVIARLMTTARDTLAKAEAILVAAIEVHVPELVVARSAIGEFQSMIRSRKAKRLDNWLEETRGSLVSSFAVGVEKDFAAVRNAIISPWSNGQTEGQITRLKLVKRQIVEFRENLNHFSTSWRTISKCEEASRIKTLRRLLPGQQQMEKWFKFSRNSTCRSKHDNIADVYSSRAAR